MALQYTNGKPWIHQYGLNNSANTAATKAAGSSLAIAVNKGALVVAKSRVHVLGGWSSSGGLIPYDQSAAIDSSGVIGTWSYSPLGFFIADADALLIGSYVYTFGGTIGTGYNVYSRSNVIKRATVQSDGSLASWTNYSNLPSVRTAHRCLVIKGRVHLIGGIDGSYTELSSTHNCVIDASAGLGSWSAGPSLPSTIYGWFSAFVFAGRLYVVGGVVGGALSRAIFSAPVNNDGTLGEFIEEDGPYSGEASPLFFTCSDSAVATTNNVFVVSDGSDGTTPDFLFDDVWSISGSDFITDMDPWTQTQDLTYRRTEFNICITSSRLYILGGAYNYSDSVIMDASTLSEYIPFSGGLNDYTSWNSYTYLPAYGVVEQPFSTVSGSAINGIVSGYIEQSISEVSGAAGVYCLGAGVLEQAASDVAGVALNPIRCIGNIEQDLSTISGQDVYALATRTADGSIEQDLSVVSGVARNALVRGVVDQPLSEVFGAALVSCVGFGKIRDYLSVVDGFAFSGMFVGIGVVDQPTSTISGAASTWSICNGVVADSLSEVTGMAVNFAPLIAFGQIEQPLSSISGIGTPRTEAAGTIDQGNTVQGMAVYPNVGFGVIAQEIGVIHGRVLYTPTDAALHYDRCSTGVAPTINPPNATTLSFSRNPCGSFVELDPAPDLTPLSYSR